MLRFVYFAQFILPISRKTGVIFVRFDSEEFVANKILLILANSLLGEKYRARVINHDPERQSKVYGG